MHLYNCRRTTFLAKFSLFEYVVVPLGISYAPKVFPELMNSIFQEALDYFYAAYLDDILTYLCSTLEHTHYIEWVLSKLRSKCLFAKTTKCEFGLTK